MITLNTSSWSSAEAFDGIALAISVRASRYQTPGRFSTRPAANAIVIDPRDSARLAIDGFFGASGSRLRRVCLLSPRLIAPLQIPQATARDTAPATIEMIGLVVRWDVLTAPEDSSPRTIAMPAITLIVSPPARKPNSMRSGRGRARIRITPARSVGYTRRRERQQYQGHRIHARSLAVFARSGVIPSG